MRVRLFFTISSVLISVSANAGNPGDCAREAFGQYYLRQADISGSQMGMLRPGRLAALKPFDPLAAERDLKTLPHMLYFDEKVVAPEVARSFVASNEIDWYKIPLHQDETDVVLGFGTNSAWDVALRRKAKKLVIGDWDPQPLIGQEYVMKPLLEIAESPAEFLSLLAGYPLRPETLRAGNLNAVFEELNRGLHIQARMNDGTAQFKIDDSQINFINQTLARLQSNPQITDMQLTALYDYYEAIVTQGKNHLMSDAPRFGPLSGFHIAKAHDSNLRGISPLYNLFNARYHPQYLIKRGGDPAVVEDEGFSVLSSQESFDYLKKLFRNVSYVKGSYDDKNLNQSLRVVMDSQGFDEVTFSISNIQDCMYKDACQNSRALARYLDLIYKTFDGSGPIHVMRVRSVQYPHQFEEITLRSPEDYVREIARLRASSLDQSAHRSSLDQQTQYYLQILQQAGYQVDPRSIEPGTLIELFPLSGGMFEMRFYRPGE